MTTILLIGAGKMGAALLSGWLNAPGAAAANITVVESDPMTAEHIALGFDVRVVRSLGGLSKDWVPKCVLLAVKPQSLDDLMPGLAKHFAGQYPLYLSIAAGKTIGYFEKYLGKDAAIIRAMPNTPALVGQGASVLCGNQHVDETKLQMARQLFKAVGETVVINDESQMDTVTALSGSGPAYLFLFADAMIESAVAQGLDEDIARLLTLQTLKGSSILAMQSDESLEQLRINVTSPAGTTEAALKTLMGKPGLKELMDDAMRKAAARSKQLAK